MDARIDKIERQIERLSQRAAALLERERQAEERISAGGRGGRRAAHRLERLRAQRAELVDTEIRAIMLALQKQSGRTRERLDRELERLVPLEREWDRLRSMFDSLEETLAKPGLDQLTGQWRGGLEIPAFPITEQTGYIKPFPPKAILF